LADLPRMGPQLELTMKSMGCGLMECLEGSRNPCKLLKRWSGRPDSNRRHPAWEHGTSLCLQHLRVSDALFRLTQVSPYQSFPVSTLLIEVGSRYIVFPLIPCFVLHPMATNSNGPRWSASHRPIGVKNELPQRHYTPPRPAKKRRKQTRWRAAGRSPTYPRNAHRFGPHSCRPRQPGRALDRSGTG